MPKLTKLAVDKAQPTDKDAFLWDSEVIGFGLKITKLGHKSFVFKYRTPEGLTKRLTIGTYSETMTVEQARKKAKECAVAVHDGRDPQGEKLSRRDSLTVAELLDAYQKSEAFLGKADSTRESDKGRILRHLKPLIGGEFVNQLTAEAVRKAHRDIKEGKTAVTVKTKTRGLARVKGGEGAANKSVMLLSAVYKWALDQTPPLADRNPVNMREAARSGSRERILQDAEEYQALFTTMTRLENEKILRHAVGDAIRLLALTGARRGEIINLLWRHVDLAAALITIPPALHKAGKKTGKPRYIGLANEAVEILARQPKGEADERVFKPSKGDGPIALNKPWRQIRKAAGLPDDLVLHGLRHSIGSQLAMAGGSAAELMETLGHSQMATTARYLHFAHRTRSTLAQRAASVAVAGLTHETSDETSGK